VRIAPRPGHAYPWHLRPFFWNQRRKCGKALDAVLLWAPSPRLFLSVAALYGALDRKRSPIDPRLRSLLTVRVSQINHRRFCVDLNSALLRRGISEAKLLALDDWRASNLFSARERVALDYAEAMARSDLGVDDALWARVKEHFDDDALIELTALIAFQKPLEQVQRRARGSAPGLLPAAARAIDQVERRWSCSRPNVPFLCCRAYRSSRSAWRPASLRLTPTLWASAATPPLPRAAMGAEAVELEAAVAARVAVVAWEARVRDPAIKALARA
jgi:AhpD family alkylhydroperoxidase